MGRGDKRTKRGKIWRGSHGKTRPHKVKKATANKNKQEQEQA
ncbi:MAG: 30S ribosomal protein THX [Saprospiraceae bacterium]